MRTTREGVGQIGGKDEPFFGLFSTSVMAGSNAVVSLQFVVVAGLFAFVAQEEVVPRTEFIPPRWIVCYSVLFTFYFFLSFLSV